MIAVPAPVGMFANLYISQSFHIIAGCKTVVKMIGFVFVAIKEEVVVFFLSLFLSKKIMVSTADTFSLQQGHYFRVIANAAGLVPDRIAVEIAGEDRLLAFDDPGVIIDRLPHLPYILVLFIVRIIGPYGQ